MISFSVICSFKIFTRPDSDYVLPNSYTKKKYKYRDVIGESNIPPPYHASDIDHVEINNLYEAKMRIRELEEKLANLELRIPKKFPDVKFLNYHSRKRILVSICDFFYWFLISGIQL